MSVKEKLTAIADAVRAGTGTQEPLSLDAMAQGVGKIHATAGAQIESYWWDMIQNYGKRNNYQDAFYQFQWTRCQPKYPMKPVTMFEAFCDNRYLEEVDWSKIDSSVCTSWYYAFRFCSLTRVDMDIVSNGTAATEYNSTFRECQQLQWIKSIKANPISVWKDCFTGCSALTHVIFTGTIGSNGLNLQWSTGLDKESIESIIHALSATTSGLSITLSLEAVDNAFNGSSGSEWTALIATKPNWTIHLI